VCAVVTPDLAAISERITRAGDSPGLHLIAGFKPDPFGERKFRTIIDGYRLAAHIGSKNTLNAFGFGAGADVTQSEMVNGSTASNNS
jgi:hypothetical protein